MRLTKVVKKWLQKRGIILRQVNYRVDVPVEPLPVQKVLFERLGIKRPIIFDIGANLGDVTVRYRRLFPEAEIYCFEPLPELFEGLQKRFADDARIHLVPLAVSDRVGTADFQLTGSHTTNSLQPRKHGTRRYYQKSVEAIGKSIEVKTTSLDAFCAEQGLEEVDILKFDIQGGERIALQGAVEMLTNQKVKLILTESALIQHYEGEALLYEVSDFLAGNGFSLYDLYHLFRARNGQLRYCDAIFVSHEMRQKVLNSFPEEP